MKASCDHEIAYRCLLASSFLMAFSLPAGRAMLAVCFIVTLWDLIKHKKRPFVPPVVWLGFAFLALTAVVTVFGVNPSLGVPKLTKLLWFMGIPLAAILVTSSARLSGVLGAYAVGAGVLAAQTCLFNPIHARMHAQSGLMPDFRTALIDLGSMTDGQRLMLAVVVSLGFLIVAVRTKREWRWWGVLLALHAAALALNFKRGSWFCAFGLVVILVGAGARRRYVLLVLLLGAATLAFPSVRARLGALASEFREGQGGRMTMWTRIAPVLIREHPWGIGYRSLTNEMMRKIEPRVEPNRDHLHSNVFQVLVESGWLGLFLYLMWMGWSMADAAVHLRRSSGLSPPERVTALILLLMLAGLLANGIVEYNLGDAEIVLLYGLVMGSAAAGRRRCQGQAAGELVLSWKEQLC